MTSSEPMNETTENFIKALSELSLAPIESIIIKLTYDPITQYVTGCTFEETDQPFVEITREQWNSGLHYQTLRVINGKPVAVERNRKRELALVPGNQWHTDRSNMLVIGTDKGWDERTYS